jgi:DNA-binding response OmpR family regulator
MNPKISIITNDILFWNLIKPLLIAKNKDAEILVCTNYQEIDSIFEKYKFDLIILDGGMTGISSIELLRYLRSSKQVIAPIWFFPEILTEAYLYRSKLMGASKIINKPFDPYIITDEILALFINEPIQK